MKKILSFVMALAMVTSLMATPKVALLNKSAKKTRTELTLPAVQKQQPQVKHVAKKNIARKAVSRKAAMASSELYKVDFTASQGGWTIQDKELSSLTYVWKQDAQYGMKASAYNKQAYAAESWLISPAIDLTSATEATLKLNQAVNKGAATNLKVKVSADNGVSWSDLSINMPAGTSWDYQEDEADLADYVGSSINLAFAYVSTTSICPTWQIKDLVITGDGGTPTPPTPSGDVTITGLNYADAIYYADETYGDYWAFDFYKELDEEGYILSPYVYFVCEESATSGTKIAGTWTAYDAGYFATDDEESGIYTDESNPVGSLTVTCVSQGVYNFVGSFVGEDGKTYTWTLNNMEVYAYNGDTYEDITLDEGDTPTPPTPGDTIYSTINHPVVMDSIAEFGWIYVSGQNEEYSLGIQVNTDHLVGEFTNEDIEMEYTQMIDWVAYNFVDIESIPSVVIAQIADTLRFTVTVKATDGQVYVVTLNDFVAQPTGEEIYVDIVLPDVSDATETEGWFQTMGYDVTGEYYASICVNTTNMFGTFGDADMDWEYTGLYIGETSVQLIENSISVTVFNVADTVVFRTEVLDVDGTKWIITMKDFTPTPTEVIDLVTVEAEGEYSAEYGDYYASGVTADGDQIALDIYMDKLASGTFTIADVETYYSGIELADGTFVEFYSADITLTVDGGNVLIEAVIIGRDVKQYNVTMEITGAQPSGDHTIVIADYGDINFTTLDGAYTVASAQNGGSSAPVYNADGKDARLYAQNTFTLTSNNGAMTEIVFNISEKGLTRQADIAVSAGSITSYDMTNAKVTWVGNATEVVFTVGDKNTHGTDAPSKAGQFDFTSIDIVNPATGLFDVNVNANVNKFMYNGNVMINVNGVIYNVLGAKVAR
ncbi:MAG: choice-of-anchor J domain-containing protein [Paludibacteraceae bacterium]|nr:choice-of-anchor J domain-containing protein [Paludibacteraceae bacterium]